jgi:hypothetical protein
MIRKTWIALAVMVLSLASGVTLRAQDTRATLSGTVTDASGGALPGVNLTLLNTKTNTVVNVKSNDAGEYRFLFVDPGSYGLRAVMKGYTTFSEQNIVLNVSQNSTVDVKMAVGSESQTVTVTADQPLLESEKSDRGLVLSQRSVEELPISVRNPIVLTEITPGVTQQTQRYDLLPFTNNGNSQYAINGITGDATENLLDGAPNDMIYQGLNSIAYIPSVDAVAEFNTLTAPYDAQYGRTGGGVISVQTKAGANRLHGSGYDFVERAFLNSNTWTNNFTHTPKSDQSLNEYGLTLGGPIVIPHLYNGHNKSFFFFGWEGYGQNIDFSQVISIPTLAQRAGDFSATRQSNGALVTIYDPTTGTQVGNNWVRSPYPNNKIPTSQIDPTGQAILNLLPAPNLNQSATVNWQNNYYAPNITQYYFNNVIGRVDHTFSDKWKVYARYAWNKGNIHQDSNLLPGVISDDRTGTKTNNDLVFDSVTTLRPTLLLDLKGSITRWTQNFLPQGYGKFDATQIGMPASQVNQFQEAPRFPQIVFSTAPQSSSSFPNSTTTTPYEYLGNSSGNTYFAPTTALTAEPTLIWSRGHQSIKTGFDWRWTRFASFQGAFGGGAYNATSTFTESNYLNTTDATSGNPAASLLLGTAYQGEVDTLPHPYWSLKYYGIFLQDDVKVTSRLTVNLGVRYDIQTPITERHNIFNHGFYFGSVNPIDAAANHGLYPGTVFGGLGFVNQNGNGRSPFAADYGNIMPRVGAAYRINDGLVVRGGYGFFYVPQFSQASQNGFSQPTPFIGTTDNGKTIANKLSNPFPTGIKQPTGASLGLATLNGNTFTFSDPSGQIGHVQSFTFGFQKQIPAHITVDASYVGTRASQLPISLNINALSPANLALGDSSQGGTASYLAASVANPFVGLLPGTTLNGATTTRSQLLRPFPEFGDITMADIPIGKNWYNALQITLQQRTWHGLDLTVGYTLQKNIQATVFVNPQDAAISGTGLGYTGPSGSTADAFADGSIKQPTHSLTPYDRPQRINVAPVYELPFGKNHQFFSQQGRLLNLLISGWQGSAQVYWEAGSPTTAPAGLALIGNPKVGDRSFNHVFNTGVRSAPGTTYSDGTTVHATVAEDLANPAWQILPVNALKKTPVYLSNVRDYWGSESNITATKNNYFHDGMNLQFRFEFLNAFNHPIFGTDPTTSSSSPTFGQFVRSNGQTNVPRTIQLAARFVF